MTGDSETDNMDRLLRVLELKIPTNRVGVSEKIDGNSDNIRIVAKRKEEQLIIFVLQQSPERTEVTVENILDDHNAEVIEEEDPKGQMRSKYYVESVDEDTFW